MSQGISTKAKQKAGETKKGTIMVDEIYSELDFVFICSDGKKFLSRKEAEEYEEELKGENYKIFNI